MDERTRPDGPVGEDSTQTGPQDSPQDEDRLQDHVVEDLVDQPGSGPSQEVSDDDPGQPAGG